MSKSKRKETHKTIIQFRNRKTTECICLLCKETLGKSKDALWRLARRAGELDVPFHYLVQRTGIVQEGRPLEAIAGHKLPFNDTTVYVQVDTKDVNKITDAQKKAIGELVKNLQCTFPGVQLVKV